MRNKSLSLHRQRDNQPNQMTATIQINAQTRRAKTMVLKCLAKAGCSESFRYNSASQSIHGGAAFIGEWNEEQKSKFNTEVDKALSLDGWDCDPIEIY